MTETIEKEGLEPTVMTVAEADPLNAIRYAVESWQEYGDPLAAMTFLDDWQHGDLTGAEQYREFVATTAPLQPSASEQASANGSARPTPATPEGLREKVAELIRDAESDIYWSCERGYAFDSTALVNAILAAVQPQAEGGE